MELENNKIPLGSMDQAGFNYDEILSFSDEKQSHKWSVSWSDLMMTMFIFFAVMYMYQVGDKDLEFGSGPGKNHLSEQGSNMVVNINPQGKSLDIYDQTKQAIQEVMVYQKNAVDLISAGTVRIILAGDLFFDSGSADLKLGAKYQLNQIARVLNENELAINVVGHTDDTPSSSERYPTNWELSSKRAVMVARYLTEVKKIDQDRIFISAHSFYQPVRPNDTSYNRSLNRRVEIILMKQKPYVQ
ncbi:MAG: OmpA family protein [Desulfobacula sp.]|nr:OmpA family protein [Desulfobacula sp.]